MVNLESFTMDEAPFCLISDVYVGSDVSNDASCTEGPPVFIPTNPVFDINERVDATTGCHSISKVVVGDESMHP